METKTKTQGQVIAEICSTLGIKRSAASHDNYTRFVRDVVASKKYRDLWLTHLGQADINAAPDLAPAECAALALRLHGALVPLGASEAA